MGKQKHTGFFSGTNVRLDSFSRVEGRGAIYRKKNILSLHKFHPANELFVGSMNASLSLN